MSEKKYLVPEEMLKAVCQHLWTKWGYTKTLGLAAMHDPATSETWAIIRESLQIAIRWLAENPPLPTDVGAIEMIGTMSVMTEHSARIVIEQWLRRMFLAPEPKRPDVRGMIWKGYTFTQEEADLLIHEIKTATNGYVEND